MEFMRKLLLLVFVLVSFSAIGQVVQFPTNYGVGYRRTGADTLLWIPTDTFSVPGALSARTHIARKGVNLYYWTGTKWEGLSGGVTDTTSLSNRINLKLNITDTSNKWITSIYRKTASDSVFYVKGGTHTFAFKDSVGTGGGGSSIANYANVYVDSAIGNDGTGVVGDPSKPFKKIDAALDATSSYLKIIINIGLGTYDSITSSKLRANMWLKGSKQPTTNSLDTSTALTNLVITRPTKLLQGTIIYGGVSIKDKSGIVISDLGFDCGSDWIAAGHAKQDNISIGSVATGVPVSLMNGIRIQNVTCLGDTSTTAKHNIIIENAFDPYVNNVLCVGFTTGLGSKNVGGLFTNITSYWHSSHSIIFKANNYAPSHESVLNGFNVRSLSQTDRESMGVNFQNETGVNIRTNWVVTNGNIRFTNVGMIDYADADYYGVSISNVNIHKTNGTGIQFTGFSRGSITNCFIDSANVGNGVYISSTTGGNTLTGNQVLGNGAYGLRIAGGSEKTYLFNNVVKGNNYGIVLDDANTFGEDNIATGNTSGQYSGTLNGILKPYLATAGQTLAGATSAGVLNNITLGTNLSFSSTTLNAKFVARVGSTTSSATPTINTDNYDIYKLTAQTVDITSFSTNLSGTPNDGDILEIQITGTAARAITWGSSFVSSTITLPTTTVTTATLTTIFQYYTTSSYGNNKWVCVNSY